MKTESKLSRQMIILVVVPLVFEIVFLIALACLLRQAEADEAREQRAQAVSSLCDELASDMEHCGFAMVAYEHQPSEALSVQIESSSVRVTQGAAQLQAFASGDFELQQICGQLEATVIEGVAYVHTVKNVIDHPEVRHPKIRYSPSVVSIVRSQRVASLIQQILEREHEMANQSWKSSDTRRLVWILLIAGFASNIFLGVSLAIYFLKKTRRRLDVLMDNVGRMKGGRPLHDVLNGSDEIAQIDGAFHRLAAALAESQRKQRTTVEKALDAICTIDTSMTMLMANAAAKAVLGFDPEELSNMSLLEIVAPEDRKRTKESLDRCVEGNCDSVENRILKKDGSQADIRWSLQWSSRDEAFFCVAHDITHLKEIERVKGEFVSMISHDLRTPLMSVQTDLALLSRGAKGELPDEYRGKMSQAAEEVDKLIDLINRLLDIERMELTSERLTGISRPLP